MNTFNSKINDSACAAKRTLQSVFFSERALADCITRTGCRGRSGERGPHVGHRSNFHEQSGFMYRMGGILQYAVDDTKSDFCAPAAVQLARADKIYLCKTPPTHIRRRHLVMVRLEIV